MSLLNWNELIFHIHHMNRVNSQSGLPWWQHYKHYRPYYYSYSYYCYYCCYIISVFLLISQRVVWVCMRPVVERCPVIRSTQWTSHSWKNSSTISQSSTESAHVTNTPSSRSVSPRHKHIMIKVCHAVIVRAVERLIFLITLIARLII